MLSRYSVKKPLTVLVAVVVIILLGVISFTHMRTDLFPEMELPFVMVTTPYPGASPEKVEQEVTKPLEQSLQTLGNLAGISSVSRENASTIRVDFAQGTNIDDAIQEMGGYIDAAQSSFGSGVGAPSISKMNADMMPVMIAGLEMGGEDRAGMTQLAKTIIPRLERIEGVAAVNAFGMLEEQLHVQLNQEKIDDMNGRLVARLGGAAESIGLEQAITKRMISSKLAAENFSMPAGYLDTQNGDKTVKVGQELLNSEQIEDLALMDTGAGAVGIIKLIDVADISLTDNSEDAYAIINGNPGIILKFSKQSSASTAEVSKALKAEFYNLVNEHKGMSVTLLQDQGVFINIVTQSVIQNLLLGGGLAILILIIFLRDIRPTIVIALSIPISLMCAMVLMYFSGVTLNVISLGGLALAVGMLVDNSIVAIENIYRLRSMGVPANRAAVEGAKQVAGPLAASTLTTVCVFMPILFIEGVARQVIQDMALTIAYSLLASLLVALTLVPAAASGVLSRVSERPRPRFERFLNWYKRVLSFSLGHRALVLIAVVLLLGITAMAIPGMGISMIPSTNFAQMSATMSMPEGTETQQLHEMSDSVMRTMQSVDGVERVGALKGGSTMAAATSGSARNENEITYYILLENGKRSSNAEIRKEILDKTANMECEMDVSASVMDNMAAMMTGGSGIEVEIKGEDLDTLHGLGADVAAMLTSLNGTYDVSNGVDESTPEKRVVIDREKAVSYGLTTTQVYQQVSQALAADTTATSITVEGKNYPVVVSEAEGRRLDEQKLEDYTFTATVNNERQQVKLSEIAGFEDASSPATINRDGQTRLLTATAMVDDEHNITLVTREFRKLLDDYNLPQGYTVDIVGESQTIGDTMRDVGFMMLVALIVIYLIMVAQFQSLMSPFIIMFTIPLAFTGGMLALLIAGFELSLMAMLGFLMLSGVIVNNGIVFVDYINELRLSGKELKQALLEAGAARMRPILMTALTTILGLSTLALGVGNGSELLQPLAVVVVGGMVYATALTLIVVPVLYSLLCRRPLRARLRDDADTLIEQHINHTEDDESAARTQPGQSWGSRKNDKRPKPGQAWGKGRRKPPAPSGFGSGAGR